MKFVKHGLAAVSTALLSAGVFAAGAAPTGAAAAITQYSEDAVVTAGLLITAGIAVWGALKVGRKFGWI